MKTRHAHKPVRKCHDCGLNLGDHCGVYAVPKDKWHHGRCPGYKNADMLEAYEAEQARHRPSRRREMRKQAARRRADEPHYQGTLPLANR